jgi:hypothetical protein
VASALLWAYWPTLTGLVEAWQSVADYSHGFLVVPLAVFFLWVRRDSFPGLHPGWLWVGLLLLLVSLAMRVAGALLAWDALDGWSLLA